MSNEHRSEIIEYLTIWMTRSREAFEKMTDRELLELYQRHMNMG